MLAETMLRKYLVQSNWFSCRTLQLMMAVESKSSNRNGVAAMGMGGAESINSNLFTRLLLVTDPLLLFLFLFLVNMCGISVCSFTLSLCLADCDVTVCSFTGLDLAEFGVIVCSFTLPDILERGVN